MAMVKFKEKKPAPGDTEALAGVMMFVSCSWLLLQKEAQGKAQVAATNGLTRAACRLTTTMMKLGSSLYCTVHTLAARNPTHRG